MGLLSPHRRFVDPHDTSGLPRVSVRPPVPSRENPLPGIKPLLTPHDGSLQEILVHRHLTEPPPSRAATVLGALAMAGVAAALATIWIVIRYPDSDFSRSDSNTWAMISLLSLGFIHVLAIFSQILSGGRSRLGMLALVVLYGGVFLVLIADHLLR
jgi:hypothetical protein